MDDVRELTRQEIEEFGRPHEGPESKSRLLVELKEAEQLVFHWIRTSSAPEDEGLGYMSAVLRDGETALPFSGNQRTSCPNEAAPYDFTGVWTSQRRYTLSASPRTARCAPNPSTRSGRPDLRRRGRRTGPRSAPMPDPRTQEVLANELFRICV